MYHYFYKITNNINGHFYYGVHSTDDLNDGYMGSGKRLHRAYKKYGVEFFTKEILKFFETKEDAFAYESEIVTEDLVRDQNCYNLMCGGFGFNSYGLATVKDKNGNVFFAPVDDPKIKSGEYVGHTIGYGNYRDVEGNIYHLPKDHYLVRSGVVYGVTKNKAVVKDSNSNRFLVDVNDERIKQGILFYVSQDMVLVKDKNGNAYMVKKDDPRYVSGELVYFWVGRKHKDETKQKMSETHRLNNDQQGEKNSQFGTCWIKKNGKNKKIKKQDIDEYLSNGWVIGREPNESMIHCESEDKIDIDVLKSMRECGSSWVEIAKRFNVGKNALLRYRRRHNIE
jgi:hypothetical protein